MLAMGNGYTSKILGQDVSIYILLLDSSGNAAFGHCMYVCVCVNVCVCKCKYVSITCVHCMYTIDRFVSSE